MKTYLKVIGRMFRKHLTRFLSLVFIIIVSIGFISGFGMASDKIDVSLEEYYINQNVSDFIIKSKSTTGFTSQDVQTVKDFFKGATVEIGASLDLKISEKYSVRLQFVDLNSQTVNILEIIEGEKSTSSNEVYVEQADNEIESYEIGEQIELNFKDIITNFSIQNGVEIDEQTSNMLNRLTPITVTVKGIVQNPLNIANTADPSYNNSLDVDMSDISAVDNMNVLKNIIYIPIDLIPTYKDVEPNIPEELNQPFIARGDMYLALEDRSVFNAFSTEYEKMVDKAKIDINNLLPEVEVITLYQNYSFNSLISYSEKLTKISYLVVAAFLLITALVSFSTMTRLIDEERSQIACLKTLGYSTSKILFKYLIFAFLATIVGGVIAYFVGIGILYLVYEVFGATYFMPPMSSVVNPTFYFVTFIFIILGILAVTTLTVVKMTKEPPANLLKPKSPPAGKKVILEKIPALWKRISFKYKSTFRNVLRYMNRFIMSVVSIAFSTGLVFAGLALLDLCLFNGLNSEAVIGISLVIIVFAGLLTAVVIYTLTNISISERVKEIATLMVLGYNDNELAGYIYREVYINSFIGIVFGYPVGIILIWLLYAIIGSGTISGVSWFIWIIAPIVVLLFTFLVTLILRRKIIKINMNESLKAME